MSDAAPVDAGSAPKPAPPAPDGFLHVRGGVGGMAFQLEELLSGAAILDDLVRQLMAIEDEAVRVHDALKPYLFDSYTAGCAAMNAVADSGKEIGRVRRDLVEVSGDIKASERDYEATEARNAVMTRTGLDPWKASGMDEVNIPSLRNLTESFSGLLLSSVMNVRRGILPGAAVPFGLVKGRSDAGSALRELLALPGAARLRPRPVSAEQVGQTVETVDPSMAASLMRLEDVHARGHGEIEIIELRNGESSTWMVLIPGTEPEKENAGGSNPFDEAGIAEALAYDSKNVTPAITQALHEAGAERGAAVVAVSHSQGGVHAMNLSQDKAFLAEFDLKYVLTAGSPVGSITPAEGISSMHLEHCEDWVPAAEGQINPDTKDRVTVTLTNAASTPPGEDIGLGPGHRLDTYATGAAAVARSTDPSLVASAAVYSGAVGAGGTATVTRFKLVRESMPEKVLHQTKPNIPESRSAAGPR